MPLLIFLFGAAFSLSPVSGMYGVNEEFDVDLKIKAEEPITSFKAYLTFDPSLLSVTQIQGVTDNFPYWWEQESEDGVVKIQASASPPGFQGEGTIAKVRFKVIGAGSVQLAYDSSSLALNIQDENVLSPPLPSDATFTLSGRTFSLLIPLLFVLLVLLGLGIGTFYFLKK